MRIVKLILFSFFLLFNAPLFAIGTENLLRAEEAFKVSAQMLTPEQLELKWDISEGYYLYRDKIIVTSQTPDIQVGALELPLGKTKHDDNFGDMVVYRNTIIVKVPITHKGSSPTFKFLVKHQGCADAGVCYPPQKNSFELKIPIDNQTVPANPLEQLLQKPKSSTLADDLLPAEQAFQFFASVKDANTLHVNWRIAEGYYLYREKIQLYLREVQAVKLGKIDIPHGNPRHDEAFGDVEIFYHDLAFDIPLIRQTPEDVTANLQATFQGCAERGVCYPPMNQTLPLELPAAAVSDISSSSTPASALSEQDQITLSLRQDSLWLTLLTFFGFGLLLAFTPCIFPMIPILSGIIVGKGNGVNTLTAFLLSLCYVLASAVAYTCFGVLAALFGGNLQAAFQQPWIIGLFSAIFVLLALSMFGFYHLELPQALQARLHNSSEKYRNHSYWGAAIMGALSSLIVGPCVAAPLAGALIYIGQTGDALLGGSALFMMGLGMGVPLLILGASAGKLLPKSGHWLNATKAVCGVIMLAVAVWMLSRILPAPITMLLWAMLLIVPAIYLNALDPLPLESSNWSRLWKGLGLTMLVYGVLMLVGLSAGNTNPLQPLKSFSLNKPNQTVAAAIQFKRVRSNAELDAVIQKASAEKKLVMLDFYADWCISCQEMEAYTFADPKVQQRLKDMVLVQADVTDNTPDDQALLKRFNLIGPPATIFFGLDKMEKTAYRIVGFKSAELFLSGIATLAP